MRNNTVLARLVLSVREGETLSRQEIFSRAGTSDANYFRLLVQSDVFRENEKGFQVTPTGIERQRMYARLDA